MPILSINFLNNNDYVKFINRGTLPETIKCQKCGRELPKQKLERMKSGTYRQVCNQCKYEYYIKPSRIRRILRELENDT